jgi:hypothetical protein
VTNVNSYLRKLLCWPYWREAPKTLKIYGGLAVVCLTLGLLIISGDARIANLARTAAYRWLPPLTARGEKVLLQGQWGLLWYAEKLGAVCFNPDEPGNAQKGDWVLVGITESARSFPQHFYPKSHLVEVIADQVPGSIVLDHELDVGFFSDSLGHLPWLWASSDKIRYELWRVE